jgi:hypothetical protein
MLYGAHTTHQLEFLLNHALKPVLRIRIRRTRMFLGLMDPYADPLVGSMDTDPDPSIIKQKK